jgi:hypothetical protein
MWVIPNHFLNCQFVILYFVDLCVAFVFFETKKSSPQRTQSTRKGSQGKTRHIPRTNYLVPST